MQIYCVLTYNYNYYKKNIQILGRIKCLQEKVKQLNLLNREILLWTLVFPLFSYIYVRFIVNEK